MADAEQKVESTTEQNATVEAKDESIDMSKELEADKERFERANKNRIGYEIRHAKPSESEDETEDEVTLKIRRELERIVPKITASTQEASLDAVISQKTDDPATQEAIRFHLANSVNPNVGSLQDRVEMALAIASRKSIIKKSNELKIAAQNRSQISNTSQGAHSESIGEVKDNILSQAQIDYLKKSKGWNDKQIEMLKKNLLNKGR